MGPLQYMVREAYVDPTFAFAHVTYRPRMIFGSGQTDGRCDVQDRGDDQPNARGPKKSRHVPQIFRVAVQHVGAEEELKIAGHVTQQETKQDNAGDCHHRLFSDGAGVKRDTTG